MRQQLIDDGIVLFKTETVKNGQFYELLVSKVVQKKDTENLLQELVDNREIFNLKKLCNLIK